MNVRRFSRYFFETGTLSSEDTKIRLQNYGSTTVSIFSRGQPISQTVGLDFSFQKIYDANRLCCSYFRNSFTDMKPDHYKHGITYTTTPQPYTWKEFIIDYVPALANTATANWIMPPDRLINTVSSSSSHINLKNNESYSVVNENMTVLSFDYDVAKREYREYRYSKQSSLSLDVVAFWCSDVSVASMVQRVSNFLTYIKQR
jgi:hypothetical protein